MLEEKVDGADLELKGQQDKMDQERKEPVSDSRSIVKPIIITLVVLAALVGLVFTAIILTREKGVSEFLTDWKQVLESGNVEAYNKLCSEEFKTNYKELYEETKELIAGGNISISIEDEGIEKVPLDGNRYIIKHIPVSLSGGSIQTFQEIHIKRKGLIDQNWKIDRVSPHFSKSVEQELEQMVEGQSKETPPEQADETPLDTEFRIRQTLEVWRAAWQDKDLDRYMDCYADYAEIKRITVVDGKEDQSNLTKDGLREHMERLNRKYDKIQVTFAEPVEINGDMAEAKAKFFQEYTSWSGSEKDPLYKDIGTKELQFVYHDVEWKITNENWKIYEGVPEYPEKEF